MTQVGREIGTRPELHFDRVRTPQQDGELLVEPPGDSVGALLQENAVRLDSAANYDFGGIRLSQLRQTAQKEMLQAARRYTRTYCDVALATSERATASERILLAGHQPELFHPGVWAKNFILSRLAREQQAVAINLIIDGDLAKRTVIRVPTGSVEEPRWETIHYASPNTERSYAEAPAVDWPRLRKFAPQVARTVSPLIGEPFVQSFWPQVLERAAATENVGLAISQARHMWEAARGGQTLEVPQSELARQRSFAWFVAHVSAELPRFQEAYNNSILDYRRSYKVRSTAHPAPLLLAEDDWLEAPFWMWTAADPRRRALFVRQSAGSLELSDRNQFHQRLPLDAPGRLESTVAALHSLLNDEVSIQTRALTTTMYARLVLGDLFLHGIGGAKYDRATDLIAARFFGLQPLGYTVASATKRLPIDVEFPTRETIVVERQKLRQFQYHPELSLAELSGKLGDDQSRVADLIENKRRWIDEPVTRLSSKHRYQAIRAANDSLQPFVASRREIVEANVDAMLHQRRLGELLRSRDYSFVLFPEKTLVELFHQCAKGSL